MCIFITDTIVKKHCMMYMCVCIFNTDQVEERHCRCTCIYMCILITDQVGETLQLQMYIYVYFPYRPNSKEALYDVYVYFHYRSNSKQTLYDVYVYFFFAKVRAVRRICWDWISRRLRWRSLVLCSSRFSRTIAIRTRLKWMNSRKSNYRRWLRRSIYRI